MSGMLLAFVGAYFGTVTVLDSAAFSGAPYAALPFAG